MTESREYVSPTANDDDDRPGTSVDSHLATSAIAYLLAGPLAFGGIGFLLDWWLNLQFLMVIGAVIGMVLSVYVIWLRYGTP